MAITHQTDDEMIMQGHHPLFLHAKALQGETTELRARIATLTAAAELAYAYLDGELDEYEGEDDTVPPVDLMDAYSALFHALGKAPAPETEPDDTDLPY